LAKKYRLQCKCKGGSLIQGGYNKANKGGVTMGRSCKCKVSNTRLSKKTTETNIEWVSIHG
jgi:hypothetical protein